MKTLHGTLLALTALLTGCGDTPRGHAAEESDEHSHSHSAPHEAVGGFLVELGDHYAQLELVLDPKAGELTLYLWDGHAENPVRVTQESLQVTLELDGGPLELTAAAQASTLTGETVGDSSEFRVTHERLKGVRSFSGAVASIETQGTEFANVTFECPAEDDE